MTLRLLCLGVISPALSGAAVVLLSLAPLAAVANSALLEAVKQNPQRARALCAELKELNSQGLSYTSSEAITKVARSQNLSSTDAEILSTYVVGLYCPDVR